MTPVKKKVKTSGPLQCATPPSTGRKKQTQIVHLKYDPQKMRARSLNNQSTIEYQRREDQRLSQMLKHPIAPLEAIAVAIHPFYRGETLDGNYYEWFVNEFDGQIPDIIRRINKFRGFPQMDDPSVNLNNAQEWEERYQSEFSKKELRRYMPYLQAYWNECNDTFETHVDFLNNKCASSDVAIGCLDTPCDHKNEQWTDDSAKMGHAMSKPAFFNCSLTWNDKKDHSITDVQSHIENKRYSKTAFKSIISTSIEYLIDIAARRSTMSHTKQPASSGMFISPYQPRSIAQSPGILWSNRTDTSEDGETKNLFTRMRSLIDSSLTSKLTYSVQSTMQYHSPAGELITIDPKAISDNPDVAEIKARSDVQNLAYFNGFVPSPRNDIGPLPGRLYAEEGGHFPMGAFRYTSKNDTRLEDFSLSSSSTTDPITPQGEIETPAIARMVKTLEVPEPHLCLPQVPHNRKSPVEYHSSSPLADANIKDPLPTLHPSHRKKRKHNTSEILTTLHRTPAKRPRGNTSRWVGHGRRRTRKGRSKKGDSDGEFKFDGDDLNDEEKEYEKMPSRPCPTGPRRPRRAKD